MDRTTKERMVEELHEKLAKTGLAVLADYSGINVAQMNELRGVLRERDSELKVVKNNLLKIACEDTEYASLREYLVGPVALIMSYGDSADATKALVDYAKKNDKLDVRVGILNGQILDKDRLKVLAELPSRDVLLARLLSVFVGVHTQFVNVLAGVPREFVQVLEAYRAKKEQDN